jgi:hypothetical protein
MAVRVTPETQVVRVTRGTAALAALVALRLYKLGNRGVIIVLIQVTAEHTAPGVLEILLAPELRETAGLLEAQEQAQLLQP